MRTTFIDVTGQTFGRLTVQERDKSKPKKVYWICLCSCGKTTSVGSQNLRNGGTRSCGCYSREQNIKRLKCQARTENQIEAWKKVITKHGAVGTRTYTIWYDMLRRCSEKCKPSISKYYYGRGIRVCDEWKDFVVFRRDMGEAPPGLSLDRIDNNGDYKPGNCRWTTQREQVLNSRTRKITQEDADEVRRLLHEGITQVEIAKRFQISQGHVSQIKLGRVWL